MRLAGDYAFYDDGWRCRLSLRKSTGGLTSQFRSYDRTTGVFSSVIAIDNNIHHRLQIVVSGFNELDLSTYTGYAFTRGVVGMAGMGEWKGEPFGFFARRQPPYSIGPLMTGVPRPVDFLGSYNIYCDGQHGTVQLTELDDAAVRGTLREDGGAVFPVTASIDSDTPHQAVITVHEVSATAPTLSLWMFARPRTALAGWMDWGASTLGCYLTRFAWHR